MSEPRRHHYIPAAYLAGFTNSGEKEDKLFVFDQQSLRSWESSPDESAHKRDFYRLDPGENLDEFAIEKALGEFEGIAMPVLRKIEETKSLGTGEDFNLLINFMSLMIVRTPHTRNLFIKPMKQIAKITSQMAIGNKEIYENALKKMKEDGKEIDESITQEQLLEFIESDRYDLVFNQNFLIDFMLKGIDTLLPLLARRNWSLLITQSDEDNFICSEHPVSITWTKGEEIKYPPGFGHNSTDVLFPLNKNMAVLGRFEDLPPMIEADTIQVAGTNNRTGAWGGRFVYSCEENFKWLKEGDDIGNKDDLIKFLEQHKSK